MNAIAISILAMGGIWQDALTPDVTPAMSSAWADALLQVHSGQPTTRPKTLSHGYLHWGQCGCLMCLGQHLQNAHGETFAAVERIGYNRWKSYHLGLHAVACGKSSLRYTTSPASNCHGRSCGPNGCCPPARQRILFPSTWRNFR